MKVDCHIHTRYSRDTILKLSNIKKACDNKGILPVVLDHEKLKGGEEYKRRYKQCIPGEEVSTVQGEIIGLFLNEAIAPYQDVFEVIDNIHSQAGLVIVPHPCDKRRANSKIIPSFIDRVAKKADIIEGFNSRCVNLKYNKEAQALAKRFNKPMSAGSDSHTKKEIGNAFVEMDDFDIESPKEFLKNLKKARIVGKKAPLAVHPYTKLVKNLKRFKIL